MKPSPTLITVYDSDWNPIGEVGSDLIDTDTNEDKTVVTLTIRGDSELVPVFMRCATSLIPVVIDSDRTRTAYYVDSFDYTRVDQQFQGVAHLRAVPTFDNGEA